jgi:hypothetical protein
MYPPSPIVLASGHITRSGDTISIELHQPLDSPSFVMVVWPQKSQSHPALAALAAAMVRTLAEAQAELAAKIRNSR